MTKKVSIIIVGAGGRGTGYFELLKKMPERAEVVGVAEPRDFQRNRIADHYNLPEERRFRCWSEVAKLPKFADAVFICTQDAMHEAPAIAFAKLGYNILLEKPIAPTAEACRRICAAVKEAGVVFAVCHVLRYTQYTRAIKRILDAGTLGKVVSMQHLESVAHWHQAHSFVRGNWRNEQESSFMLLAKCCHDVDWIRYLMDRPCDEVQSFGSLYHFRAENQPEGAADRCTDCPAGVESTCPYSALKIYLRDRIFKGIKGWPTDVLTDDLTTEGVLKALKEGPYGRCVYKCDNDVVDHQVVNMKFNDGATAQMVMTAFSDVGRVTRIFGTEASLYGDGQKITIHRYYNSDPHDVTVNEEVIDTNIVNDGGILSGHGGGDGGIVDAFVYALETGDTSAILSGTDVTLESHLMTFAAEDSRRCGQVVKIK